MEIRELKELLKSAADRAGLTEYEIYYAKYGANPNDFFEIKYTVEQSTEASYLDLVSGTITLKDVGKEVVSYSFNYCITYKVKMENGDITTRDHLNWHTELRNNRFGLLIDQIEGINHEETTTVTIESWRIIYKKQITLYLIYHENLKIKDYFLSND